MIKTIYIIILLVIIFSCVQIVKSALFYSPNGSYNKHIIKENRMLTKKQLKENILGIKSKSENKQRSAISQQLDTERKRIIQEFVHKVEDSTQYVTSNITTYTSEDFIWCLDTAGCWSRPQKTAEDYGYVLFFKVPVQINGTVKEFQYSIAKLTVLKAELYQEGETLDTYKLSYFLDLNQFDLAVIAYMEQKSIYYQSYYTFKKNSSVIESETVLNVEKAGVAYITSLTSNPDLTLLCSFVVGVEGLIPGVCTVGTSLQQFATVSECIEKLGQVDAFQASTKACPDAGTSNTTACRNVHAVTAGSKPPQTQVTHCPHVGVPSTVCIDRCRTVCDLCHPKADCALNITINGTKVYYCSCSSGYQGDGVSSCTKKQCTQDWQCGTGDYYNYASCDTVNQICSCKPSFTWNPTTGRCECQGEAGVRWINGVAVCLPKGRCQERSHCTTTSLNSLYQPTPIIGDWSDLQCLDRGVSSFFPYKSCICNYGFTGGFFTPCLCQSPRSKVWSSTVQGNVCLSSQECTENWQCGQGKSCNKNNGPSLGVGLCQ